MSAGSWLPVGGSSCLLSGLPVDPLVDAEVWRYDLVLGTPSDGTNPAVPFDLTGSDLTMVFRTRLTWEVVATMSTIPTWPGLDGSITITDAPAGKVSIVSDPWRRTYRVSSLPGGLVQHVAVTGDVLRLLKSDLTSRPEYLGSIDFPLRASTTQWPAPSP